MAAIAGYGDKLSDSDPELSDESDAMSEDEEDNIDRMLQECASDSDDEFLPDNENQSQSTVFSSQNSMGSDPLGGNRFSWQDESVMDDKAPVPPEFSPCRPAGIQLGRFTRSRRQGLKNPTDFFKLFLTPLFVMQMCIATNQFAEQLIGQGQFLSYANKMKQWERVDVEEMYRNSQAISFQNLSSSDSAATHSYGDKGTGFVSQNSSYRQDVVS